MSVKLDRDLSRRTTGKAHPIDVYVGARIKFRRIELGLTQEMLGGLLNLTFQQIQKYEKAVSRIGASRLFEMAQILKVEVDYFFEDAPENILTSMQEGEGFEEEEGEGIAMIADFQEGSIFSYTKTSKLISYYYQISQKLHRHAIFCLIENLAQNNTNISSYYKDNTSENGY